MLDDCKIGSCVQMLSGATWVAFPAPLGATGRELLQAVEKVELVQAYGVDGYGRPGFFTMNFEVSDSRQRGLLVS